MRQARVRIPLASILIAGAAVLGACKDSPSRSATSFVAPAAEAAPSPSPSPSATLPASALGLGADPATPPEVWAFAERYENCVHFQGEEPYDEPRKKEVADEIAASCPGNEETLLALEKKYAADPVAMKLLKSISGRE